MKNASTLFTFIFFLVLSLLLFFLSHLPFFQPVLYVVTFITHPIQGSFYQAVHSEAEENKMIQQLSRENEQLRKKLIDQKKLLSENNALRDQFKTTYPPASHLLPAYVIGAPEFVPGVSPPEKLILDKGSMDGVVKGQAVISKETLIGTISQVSAGLSVVSLITNGGTPFTAKTLETGAVGVINPEGGTKFALENVILSQQLKRGDMVFTKGNVTPEGKGIPPNLLVGKIIDIDKKSSALFQTAKLKSLVDSASLKTVFIMQAGQ